jgi:ABC-type Na+ transport system ATPase subunit NatA
MWKQYENGFVAIKDITFGANSGEIFGLLGPYFYLSRLKIKN